MQNSPKPIGALHTDPQHGLMMQELVWPYFLNIQWGALCIYAICFDTERNESKWPLHGRWVWFGCGPNYSFQRQIESEGVIERGQCIYSFEKWDLSVGTGNPGNLKSFWQEMEKKCHLCYRTEKLLGQQLTLSASKEARACKWLDAILR